MEVKMQGFFIYTHRARYPEWIEQHIEWIQQVRARVDEKWRENEMQFVCWTEQNDDTGKNAAARMVSEK